MSSSSSSKVAIAPLLRLAWPVVLARATQSVIGFCDALMVAPLGEAPLAAVTTGALNTFALIILPMGTAFIVQSFVAQLRGRGELGAVPRYAWYGLALAVAAQLIALVSIPLVSPALSLLSYAPAVHDAMVTYMVIRLLSIFPAVAVEALGNWFGGLGDTRPSMIAGVVAMLANVFGNYLLIEARFGLPGYGVAGAAWASTISTWLGCAVIVLLFVRDRRASLSGSLRALRLAEFTRMLRFGLPNGVNWFLEFSAVLLFINVIVAHLGTTVLASFNVVLQINSLSFMPAFGLASAGAIMVGEAIGRGAQDEVWPLLRLTMKTACVWMGSVAVIYLLASAPLLALFQPPGDADEKLLAVGARMLVFSAFWQLFDAIGLTVGEALRAAGDTAWCMRARIVLAWFVFTPVAWVAVLVLRGGVPAVMLSFVAYVALLAAVFAWRFFDGKWRRIELLDPALL